MLESKAIGKFYRILELMLINKFYKIYANFIRLDQRPKRWCRDESIDLSLRFYLEKKAYRCEDVKLWKRIFSTY